MSSILRTPPRSKSELTSPAELAQRLGGLLGQPFKLHGGNKTRTDGSNLRKRVEAVLEGTELPPPASEDSYRILVPKAKGVTRIRREWVDTYIVTTGSSYNLQVWNRNPSEPMPQIEYSDGSALLANEIRFVLVRIDPERHVVRCTVVATPQYIVEHFGKFGKQTVKEQLLISGPRRQDILSRRPPILYHPDDPSLQTQRGRAASIGRASIRDSPEPRSLLPLERIRRFVAKELIGHRIEAGPTKTRGQSLEMLVAQGLGYKLRSTELLSGGYPDLRHQALEVKIQEGPTVDLGRYSPQFEEPVPGCPGYTTHTVGYLIALMDETNDTCVGAILCPGKRLAEHFVYVGEKSFKCQRTIPMAFFDAFDGKVVFNPPY